MLLLCLVLAQALPIEALARDARSDAPALRRKAMEALAAAGPEGVAALRPIVEDQVARLTARAERMARGGPVIPRLRHLAGAELPARRKEALAFIEDERRFTKVPESQREMERLIGLVREVWEHPARSFRAQVPELDELLRERDELDRFGPLTGLPAPPDLLARFDAAAVETPAGPVEEWNRGAAAPSATPAERRVMERTNRWRAMLGRPPLEFDDRLVRAARAHSREMLELRYFAHESPTPGLRTPGERARAAGFAGSCGENIASHGDPDAAFDGWVHSPGHHRNLVGARWRQLGVGNAAAERRSSFTMLLGNGDSLRGRKH